MEARSCTRSYFSRLTYVRMQQEHHQFESHVPIIHVEEKRQIQ